MAGERTGPGVLSFPNGEKHGYHLLFLPTHTPFLPTPPVLTHAILNVVDTDACVLFV